MSSNTFQDLTGLTFHGVVVVRRAYRDPAFGGASWLYRMPCGHTATSRGSSIQRWKGTPKCQTCRALASMSASAKR